MSFLERIGFVETVEQERTRLAEAPEGLNNQQLSKLPITITECPKDLLIELPWQATERGDHRVVVVPIEYRRDARPEGEEGTTPRQRHSGSWTCAVVASDHPSYPAGAIASSSAPPSWPAARRSRCDHVQDHDHRAGQRRLRRDSARVSGVG